MPCLGVHFALTNDDERQLLSIAGNDEATLNFLQENIEERWDEEWLRETGKAWDAIHRCLTDGTLKFSSESPLHMCILGGRQMYSGRDYIISYLDADDVREVAQAIGSITETGLRKRYFAINELDYDGSLSEEDFSYTWEHFFPVQTLFANAAAVNRSIIFSVDQ